jgi:glycosyltransferase involved in cell wall biosynthesis
MPTVSCILPTGYGEKYVRTAIECFLSQVYPADLELVIVDNNEEPIKHVLPPFSIRTTYVRSEKTSIGAMRNLGTASASGEICITWDEDDWSHPERVTKQVQRLLETGKAVTGWHSILCWDIAAQKGYKYVYESSGRPHPPYAMGTSQCYRKSWWQGHKFVEQGVEDWPFSDAARDAKQLDSCDADQLCVALIHGSNAVPKKKLLGHSQFRPVELSEFPQQFFDAMKVSN